jgi:hypothetical protein
MLTIHRRIVIIYYNTIEIKPLSGLFCVYTAVPYLTFSGKGFNFRLDLLWCYALHFNFVRVDVVQDPHLRTPHPGFNPGFTSHICCIKGG